MLCVCVVCVYVLCVCVVRVCVVCVCVCVFQMHRRGNREAHNLEFYVAAVSVRFLCHLLRFDV